MSKPELRNILAAHQKWLNGVQNGKRANLQGANLQGAYLQRANLRDADLQGAYLQRAYLQDADLQGAYLQGVNLQGADLRGVNLRYANLQGVNLQGADLQGADLRGAYLHGSDFRGADLSSFQIAQHCELRVYKKVQGKIVHLLIPRFAKRTASLAGRKCRASCAYVLAIQGDTPVSTRGVTYKIGAWVYPDSYDGDIRVVCTHGIHFFQTRKEAEEY